MIDERLDQIMNCLHRVTARAIIIRGGKILLTGELPEPGTFGTPGGGIEHDGRPRETIVRELKEELGLDVKLEQISENPIYVGTGNILTDLHRGNGHGIPYANLYYRVELEDNQDPVALDNEFIWVDLDELKSMPFVSCQSLDKPFVESILGNER